MTDHNRVAATNCFALQVQVGGPDGCRAVSGRLEHVLSGRRKTFASGAELLELLQQLLDARQPPASAAQDARPGI